MRVRFWGTRGSIPKPGPETVRYGGNTSCLEVVADDGTRVVIDCGTGAHALAAALGSAPESGPEARSHLLVSHTHWDHIQGFPFFSPLFEPGQHWTVRAPGARRHQTERSLSGQMSYEHHPVVLQSLASSPRFEDLQEGSLQLGSIRVTTQLLKHTALTLGYRLEVDGAVFVYAADHEPHAAFDPDVAPGSAPAHAEDRRHVAFLRDADLVVHDAQYTLAEFPEKAGWGHTPVEQAVDYGLAAGARRLALFSHDPTRNDDAIRELEERARKRVDRVGSDLDVFAAAEGRELELRGSGSQHQPTAPDARLSPPGDASARTPCVLLVDADRETADLVAEALEPEGIRLRVAHGEEEATRGGAAPPDLVLLDGRGSEPAAADACRSLREALPCASVLVLAHEPTRAATSERAFAAGAHDFLSGPIKSSQLRSRVQGWLLRSRRSARA
ncbi:MAG: MBL fold metallo-hydrolase [Myxococcota bacterium]|nr:MBL fold metallo-hydrolase [Myxococcota bacterium]